MTPFLSTANTPKIQQGDTQIHHLNTKEKHSTLLEKITEKVSFNIASEASYVYILSGQRLIKNTKNGQFGEFLNT